jgi:di/tricarboxylate transporter
VLAIMYSAAASFSTPLGYPTNLMVYGPGAYKFTDFMKAGFPLNIALMIVAVYLIPLIWAF